MGCRQSNSVDHVIAYHSPERSTSAQEDGKELVVDSHRSKKILTESLSLDIYSRNIRKSEVEDRELVHCDGIRRRTEEFSDRDIGSTCSSRTTNADNFDTLRGETSDTRGDDSSENHANSPDARRASSRRRKKSHFHRQGRNRSHRNSTSSSESSSSRDLKKSSTRSSLGPNERRYFQIMMANVDNFRKSREDERISQSGNAIRQPSPLDVFDDRERVKESLFQLLSGREVRDGELRREDSYLFALSNHPELLAHEVRRIQKLVSRVRSWIDGVLSSTAETSSIEEHVSFSSFGRFSEDLLPRSSGNTDLGLANFPSQSRRCSIDIPGMIADNTSLFEPPQNQGLSTDGLIPSPPLAHPIVLDTFEDSKIFHELVTNASNQRVSSHALIPLDSHAKLNPTRSSSTEQESRNDAREGNHGSAQPAAHGEYPSRVLRSRLDHPDSPGSQKPHVDEQNASRSIRWVSEEKS